MALIPRFSGRVPRYLTVVALAVLFSAADAATTAKPVNADDTTVPFTLHQVTNAFGPGTTAHTAGPHFSTADRGAFLPNGTQLDIVCHTKGDPGPTMWNDTRKPDWPYWDLLADGTWVFDGDTNVLPDGDGVGNCGSMPQVPTAPGCNADPENLTTCNAYDPEVSRCVKYGLVRLASAPIGDPDGGRVQLFFSRTCHAGWLRAIWPQSAAYFAGRKDSQVSMLVGNDPGYFLKTVSRQSQVLWTPMTDSQRGQCLYGHAVVHTAQGDYTSPELRDCS